MHIFATHTCGSLRKSDVGIEAHIIGRIHRVEKRDGFIFIDLCDYYGKTQVVIDPKRDFYKEFEFWRVEMIMCVVGKVAIRSPMMTNIDIATGEIEIVAEKIEIPVSLSSVFPSYSSQLASFNFSQKEMNSWLVASLIDTFIVLIYVGNNESVVC